MSDVYETDILVWSDQQAALLRRHAAGERLNETPDWQNIAEEIESLGRSQIVAVESLLLQALVHEFKTALWPNSAHVEHWQNEARLFQTQAAGQFTNSMRQRIDPAKLMRRASNALPRTIDGQAPQPELAMSVESALLDQVSRWLGDPDGVIISWATR